jgi:hypothetical protein
MTEARVGRLLAASLHQAISDVLPLRLEFYEVWLKSEGLRDGSIGLAPITAVLGFLRTEDAYARVVERAGRLAAEWSIASMSPFERRAIGWLPRSLRARAALRVAAGVMRHVFSATRASSRIRRGAARLDVTASLFCSVRDVQTAPLCGFYAAVAAASLATFGIPARAQVEQCRAVNHQHRTCAIALEFLGADAAVDPALAA